VRFHTITSKEVYGLTIHSLSKKKDRARNIEQERQIKKTVTTNVQKHQNKPV
jgi:hypothetical protein